VIATEESFPMGNDHDERQGRPQSGECMSWLRWLCKPVTLRLLIKLGMVLVSLIRAVVELLRLLKC
jgi:hypothetical protein